jgi:hypothetical protein
VLQYSTFLAPEQGFGFHHLLGVVRISVTLGVSLLAHRPHHSSEDLFNVLPGLGGGWRTVSFGSDGEREWRIIPSKKVALVDLANSLPSREETSRNSSKSALFPTMIMGMLSVSCTRNCFNF